MVWSLRLLYALADPGERAGGPAPPYFRPNWGAKGRKKYFETGLPPYLRVWMTGAPLISGSGWPVPPLSQGLDDRCPPYLRVWMTGAPLISGSGWPVPPLSEGLDPPLVCTSLLRECDVLLVATWNYAYRNLEVGYNEFSPKMVMYLGLCKEETPRGSILVRNHLA